MGSGKIVLVLASRDDIHADAVVAPLNDLGHEVVRIDLNDFWPKTSSIVWSINNSRSKAVLNWQGRAIDASQVGAVFNRNFSFAKAEMDQDIGTLLKYAEAHAALYGFFRSLENVYWMNPPWYDEMADNKPYQYSYVQNAGLKVPRTLITNNPKDFLDFYEACNKQVIIKQLSEVCLIEEVEYPSEYSVDPEQTAYGFFTNMVDIEHLENIEEITNSPCLFQEHIVKKGDIRVTVVGDKVFSVLIDSQSSHKTTVDFRHEPFLPFQEYVLPGNIKKKLLEILRQWDLQFAACDFVLTPDDELVFLEANVVGNWLWLEKDSNSKIGESIAQLLTSSF